jgi:hypothetical protein
MQWRLRRRNGSATARRPYLAYKDALTRDCCSGISMSAGGSSDSAVIDSRYKHPRSGALRESGIHRPRLTHFSSTENVAVFFCALDLVTFAEVGALNHSRSRRAVDSGGVQ